MLPWRAAVAIASASLRSFFVVRLLRNGATNWAAISFGVNPYDWQYRAQCLAPLQASIATIVPTGICASQGARETRRKSLRCRLRPRSQEHTTELQSPTR